MVLPEIVDPVNDLQRFRAYRCGDADETGRRSQSGRPNEA
jgi:hypothetical protein